MEKNKGGCYCRPEFRRQPRKGRTSKRRCCVCNFRVRGDGHYEGSHHKKAEAKQGD